MRRPAFVAALLLALAVALAPGLGFARAGYGSSFGSRGGRTYMAPPGTATAPYAAPFQRSLTPQAAPYAPGPYAPGYGGGGFGRSPFMSGLLGGLVGAGIGGLLFGRGLFGGITGFGGFLGLLLQIFLIVLLVRWLLRSVFARNPAMAGPGGPGGMFARGQAPGPRAGAMAGAGGAPQRAIAVTQTDYLAFEQLLKMVQAAWSSHDIATLRQIASPEMASYFAEQMGEQTSQGVRNTVSDVRLLQGDLSEAWAEPGREYATVAMRFSMIDETRDAAGRIVDGSPTEHVQATEVWTFLRAPGGRWILSAIQQTR